MNEILIWLLNQSISVSMAITGNSLGGIQRDDDLGAGSVTFPAILFLLIISVVRRTHRKS